MSSPAHWSLRWRLLAMVVLLLAGALCATALATAVLMQKFMVQQVDEQLEQAAVPVAQSALQGVTQQDDEGRPPNNYWIQFMPVDGSQPIAVSRSIATDEQPRIGHLAPTDERVRSGEPFTVSSASGHRWRVVAGVDSRGIATFAVARPLHDIDEAVRQMQVVALTIGLFSILVGALLGWPLMNRAFRPLTQIEDTAAAIADGDLSQRVPHPGTRDEVGSLAASLNLMLTHIERSFAARDASEERMRRFVADASHELRTPMAAVRGYAELYRSGAIRGEADTAAAMRRIEDEATRMGGLVEDLMTLTRLDAGQRPGVAATEPAGTVDLLPLATDAVADTHAWAPERKVRLRGLAGAPLGPAEVTGRETQLRQVVTNLVANAVRHTDSGPVEVELGRVEGAAGREVVLRVVDHGPGIPAEEREQVFERFYRSDPSRQRGQGGGSGLGLAIVASTVEGHGGTVRALGTPGGGATFEVRLPATSQPEHRDAPDVPKVDGPQWVGRKEMP
ncbi:two-component system, OmpR family, sensor kinase [Kytococcus aerolatus]|uniref:histidine kinase n=1 Tax=Kytococcus aerolatus TaxID=592308 RepID=A0A212TBG0_9MICO|nr:HAMP domain-containing sensor histidine kinase [Kytococcus aerolatus]SNC63171.1 two-component system, OmpR family, sensor kinase [Kytococcus aerolatus]